MKSKIYILGILALSIIQTRSVTDDSDDTSDTPESIRYLWRKEAEKLKEYDRGEGGCIVM